MKITKLSILLLVMGGSAAYAADPTLSLKNKSADAIQIDVMQSNKSLTGLRRVAKNDDFELAVDTSKPTTIDIHYCPTAAYCKTNTPDKVTAKIKAGKTIYVKFDSNGKLIPQEGNKATGKTTAGYSTKNNVARGDISISQVKSEKLRTGTAESIAQEIQKNKKPTNDPTEMAWAQFPEANKYRNTSQARLDSRIDTAVKTLAYKVLGVSDSASETQIKSAYKTLSLKFHPDKYQGDKQVGTEAVKIVSKARDVALKSFESTTASSSKKQELIGLFDAYPKGYKEFADPIYDELTKEGYNKQLLLSIQKRVKDNTALPPQWKMQVLKTIDAELQNM